MREINFRLWNGSAMEAVYSMTFHTDGSFHVNDEYPVNDTTMESQFGGNTYFLMHVTTYKDKNGREIYEGDIVQMTIDGVKFRGLVTWNLEHGAWNPWSVMTEAYANPRKQVCEVIGNIYENPELLT